MVYNYIKSKVLKSSKSCIFMKKIEKRLENQENSQGCPVLLIFMGNLEELPYAEALVEALNREWQKNNS